MPISPEEYKRRFPDRPDPIPMMYQGKWIALSHDRRTIIASADELLEVRRLASELGHDDPLFQFVPRTPNFGYQSLRLRRRVSG